MTDYDPELEIIKAKKLLKMKKKITEEKPKPKTDRDIFIAQLVDRGIEVLSAAEAQYPRETALVVAKIVELIKSGELKSKISGGELLALFRSIGLRVRMNTRISIEEHGKLVSLSDRLKSKQD